MTKSGLDKYGLDAKQIMGVKNVCADVLTHVWTTCGIDAYIV